MKAMILAAGLGTRLRPLTLERAKPAVPLLGKPLVIWLIEKLKEVGVTHFRLNLHHLPHTVEAVFHCSPRDMFPVTFSYEDKILGTAGGLKNNEAFFHDGTFIMANGDILAELPLTEALAFHKERGALATLILCQQTRPYAYYPVRIDKEGRLCNFKGVESGGEPRKEVYVFTGIHILEPEIFDFIPGSGFSEINDTVYPAALRERKAIFGFPTHGYWNDLGNPRRYLDTQRELFRRYAKDPAIELSIKARTHDRARVGPYVSAGPGCVFERGTEVENSIFWDDVTVKSDVSVRNCIVGSGITVGNDCCDTVITRHGEARIERE